MAMMQDARLPPDRLATAPPVTGLGLLEIGNPAGWILACLLIIMPLIANGFFLIEIFGTTLILGTVALSLMFLAGYGGMVSLMQLTIAGLAGYMTAVFGASGNNSSTTATIHGAGGPKSKACARAALRS